MLSLLTLYVVIEYTFSQPGISIPTPCKLLTDSSIFWEAEEETDCKYPLFALPGNKQKHQISEGRTQKGSSGTINNQLPTALQLMTLWMCEQFALEMFTRCVKEEERTSLLVCTCRVIHWKKASASGWPTSSNVPKHSSSTAWWGGAQVKPANTLTCTSWHLCTSAASSKQINNLYSLLVSYCSCSYVSLIAGASQTVRVGRKSESMTSSGNIFFSDYNSRKCFI